MKLRKSIRVFFITRFLPDKRKKTKPAKPSLIELCREQVNVYAKRGNENKNLPATALMETCSAEEIGEKGKELFFLVTNPATPNYNKTDLYKMIFDWAGNLGEAILVLQAFNLIHLDFERFKQKTVSEKFEILDILKDLLKDK